MADSNDNTNRVFDPIVDGDNPEYIEQMLDVGAKMNALNDPNPVPDFIPEKFRNAENPLEAFAKSYAELEKKLGGGAEKPLEQDKSTEKPLENPVRNDVKSLMDSAGIDYDLLTAELTEHGNLTDESYAELAEAGFPRPIVEQYIAGQQALLNTVQNEVYAEVGGKQVYGELMEWASDNLSQPEIDAFNRITSSGDRNQISLAVSALQAKYRADGPPNLVRGGTPGTVRGASGFQSVEELRAAMSDPRYETDPAYVRSVEEKLAHSKLQW